jgi:hypothetical protein
VSAALPVAPPATRRSSDLPVLVAQAVAVAFSLLVVLSYSVKAWGLITYRWDWSPDEGLALDYGRRLLHAPETLYPHSVVPFPVAYTPLLPALLAPIVAWSRQPLFWSRLLALGWTAAIVAGLYVLARRTARPVPALAWAVLILVPYSLSFWFMLVRVDGLMVALWLWAVVLLLPARLAAGADRLSTARCLGGAALLLGAVLAKPTAVVHGLPVVLGWFLVDRKSALRLTLVLGGAGLLTLGLLQLATGGGFLWVMGLWKWHERSFEQGYRFFTAFFRESALALGLAVVGWALRRARGAASDLLRDPTWLLVVGGLLIVPSMTKVGAGWNYLLPFWCAAIVFGVRGWSSDEARIGPLTLQTAGAVAAGIVALYLAAAKPFPLPEPADEVTSTVFYDFVQGYGHTVGRPILATRPDYAYFLLGQPVEIEGSSYLYLDRARLPGTEKVEERLLRKEYGLVIRLPFYVPNGERLAEALKAGYRDVGACWLRHFYGSLGFVMSVPRESPLVFEPPPGTRCYSVEALRAMEKK